MAITPYVRIPYASERDRYTGRGYTAQQLALMDQQSERESAYAYDRAQRMADRWSGFGGLVTETLGDLRQSREVREAQALEQERYDAQQARLKRIEDEANRQFGAQEDWRRERQTETDEYREYAELKNMPPDKPFNERQIYLWNKFNPGSLRTEAGAPGRVFGDPATAPPPARDGTTVSLGPEVFRPAPAQMGERAFGGLFPATSGDETLAGVARGTRDRETGVDLGIAPDARFFAPTPGPAGPTQSFRPQTTAEVEAEERYRAAEAARVAESVLDAKRRAEDVAYRERIAAESRRQFDLQQAQRDETFTPGFPRGMANYLAKLQGRRTWAKGDVPGGKQTGPRLTREQVIEEVFGRAWPKLLREHKNIDAREVERAIDVMWPRPTASGNRREWEVEDPGQLVFSDEEAVVPVQPTGPTGLTQEEPDMGAAKVLVEMYPDMSIDEALQAIREDDEDRVPPTPSPPPPLKVPPITTKSPSPDPGVRETGYRNPITGQVIIGEGSTPDPWQPDRRLGKAFQEISGSVADTIGSALRPIPGRRETSFAIARIPYDAKDHGGLKELAEYVVNNRAEYEDANIIIDDYLAAIRRKIVIAANA